MKLLYFWCDKYLNLRNYNCNLAGNIEFSYDRELKKLIGLKKHGESEGFFNILDGERKLVPIEVSVIAGINGVGKTTSLKMISEVLANKGSIVDGDYKINYIAIYEINGKKYINFEDGLIDEIIINNKEIIPMNALQCMYDYNINILKLSDDEKSKQTLHFKELESIATLFLSNAYEETCDFSHLNNNFINLSNHYLLNNYLNDKDNALFKNIDFDKYVNLFDYWKMELLEWDIEFICSPIYDKLISDIQLVSPKYFNILLDYTDEKYGFGDLKVRRFNNKSIEKFSFELFIERSMKTTEKNHFFDYLDERVCDILAEYILSQKLISKEKIITFINEAVDYEKCSTIIKLLEFIFTYVKDKREEFIGKVFPDNSELRRQNEHTYENIIITIDATIEFLKTIEVLEGKCNLNELFISTFANVQASKNNISLRNVEIPVLTIELNRAKLSREVFEFFRELIAAQSKFFEVTKLLPIRFEANGISAGEKAYLDIFTKLFKFSEIIKDNEKINNIIILLDEADIHLHPEWKRKFVYLLTKFLKMLFNIEKYEGIHVIMSTNAPYVLSDIPKCNTILLNKSKESDEIKIKKYIGYKTLGANIIDLLDDAFFLSEGNKGDYITKVIMKISKDLNNKEVNKEKIKRYMEFTKLIDEPLIQRSLIQKLSGKLEEDHKAEMIQYYQELIDNLKREGEADVKD